MNLQPTHIQRDTVERWLPENLLAIAKDFDVWHIIATDIPEGLARSSAIAVKEIKNLQLESVQLLSLSQSVLQIEVDAMVGLSIYVNAESYQNSQEVRDWVGYDDQDFQGCYIDFDADGYLPTLKCSFWRIRVDDDLIKTRPLAGKEADPYSSSTFVSKGGPIFLMLFSSHVSLSYEVYEKSDLLPPREWRKVNYRFG